MARLGLWQIVGSELSRIEERAIDLERMLQDWIEKDPSLLQAGMTIVGREFNLDSRNRIDLLGLDLNGTWVVIELKKGKLYRETVAQALDYAAQISLMPTDQLYRLADEYLKHRETSVAVLFQQRQLETERPGQRRVVSIYIAGTGRDPAVERMAEFLVDGYGLPLTIVSFDVFGLSNGTQLLAREVAEIDEHRQQQLNIQGVTVEDVCRLAERNGVGELFRKFLAVAEEVGLYPRVWKTSIMYAPPAKRNRMLFTVWANPDKGKLLTYIGTEPFAEFFGVSLEVVEKYLGKAGWRRMSEAEATEFISGLRGLFSEIRSS